jgi:hypothetical protein
MDEEEELENMLIGQNQRRTNTRPEEIQQSRSFASTLGDLSKDVSFEQPVVKELIDAKGKTGRIVGSRPVQAISNVANKLNPNLIKNAGTAARLSRLASVANPVSGFATLADVVTSGVREDGKGLYELFGEQLGSDIGKSQLQAQGFRTDDGFGSNNKMRTLDLMNKRREEEGLPALSASESVSFLNSLTPSEDDKVDNLQKALQSVPDTPQVVPGTLPTAEEAGQRLIDAAKEFYPGAFPAEAPAAPAVPAAPALPDPARTGLTTEQMQGLSPDALQAIRTPSIPESVTSAEVPAGLGPMQFIDRETGAPLDPEVVKRVQDAGMERFLAQGAFPAPEAPASLPPMGEAETRARLQQRFGAPTISQLQSVAQPQETERDARVQDRDRRPGESQTQRDTRLANEKVTRSVSAQGRRFTDSELRRAFGDDGYQEARIKDANGINPFTNKTYADEKLERENLIADTEARKRTGTDTSDSPTQVIEDARAQAEAMAELYGLTPGTPEYDEYVRSAVAQKVGLPEYFKPKTYTEEEANAAHKAGQLAIGQSYTTPNGETRIYTGPDETEEESKPTGRRSSRLNKQIEEDRREQAQKELKEKQQEESKRDLRREGRN